jgi:DNA replication protein DnaC
MEFRPSPVFRGEDKIPNRVQSWIFWRDIFKKRIQNTTWFAKDMQEAGFTFPGEARDWHLAIHKVFENTDVCTVCGGTGVVNDDFGYYYCMCHLLRMRHTKEQTLRDNPVQSTWTATDINKFEIWGNLDQKSKFSKAVKQVKDFIEYPTNWIMLCGPTGCGKTFMLGAIMKEWHHIAVYLEASKFEDLVFKGLREQNLDEIMDIFRNIPMLILDDLGLEYSSPIIKNKLDQIIQFRAKEENYQDCITVIATNYYAMQLVKKLSTDGVSRSTSRLLDNHTIIVAFDPGAGNTPTGVTANNDFRLHRRGII